VQVINPVRRKALRAYVFMQTKFVSSKDVVEYPRRGHEESFRKGISLHGWYDAVAELEIPNTQELSHIIDDLKRNYLDTTHICTAVEITDAPCPLMNLKRVS
jgi:hypothetical protein